MLHVFFNVADHKNDQGLYILEPVEKEYSSSFDSENQDELDSRLEELREHYEHCTNVPVVDIEVTMLVAYNGYFEPRPIWRGDATVIVDDIIDLRHRIELPDGVSLTDCRFFVLYPSEEKDKEEAVSWIALLPYKPS